VLARDFFVPGNMVYGDVIQVDALYADEGMWPLLHSLANTYGLFSTGRIIPPGSTFTIDNMTYTGPKVFLPNLVVWEVFNPPQGKSARTVYFEQSGAVPLQIAGRHQWRDPRLLHPWHVQVMSKTGMQFRSDWTAQFAAKDGFRFVDDVQIERTYIDEQRVVVNGAQQLSSVPLSPGSAPIAHHPVVLGNCIEQILDSRNQTVAHQTQSLEITISIGAPVLGPAPATFVPVSSYRAPTIFLNQFGPGN